MDLEGSVKANNILTMQWIIKNQIIANYKDLVFGNPQAATSGDKNSTCSIVPGSDAFTGAGSISYNRMDVASRFRDAGENGVSGFIGFDNPEYVVRDMWRRFGMLLTADDIATVDHAAVTEAALVTFAPAANALATHGTVTLHKYPVPVHSRSVGTLTDGEDGSANNPFRLEANKVYEIPFSRIAGFDALAQYAYATDFAEDLTGTFAGDEGLVIFKRDGEWFIQYWTPTYMSGSLEGATYGRTMQFDLADANQHGSFNVVLIRPATHTFDLGSNRTLVVAGGLKDGDEVIVPRGVEVVLPLDICTPVPLPEVNIVSITHPTDVPAGVVAGGDIIGGMMAFDINAEPHLFVTNNITAEPGIYPLTWTVKGKDGNDYPVTVRFKFE